MNSSSLSEIGPTEDVVQALLDYLVDPVLPSKSSSRKPPSISQHQLVAKQVHAVVLLYNYYQRKHHTALEFLDFMSFSKLAVILKPTLMAHMNLMHRSNYAELDDLKSYISLTEKAIMDACDISSVLDASKDVPIAEGWPISKVAVLLVDFRRENCFLLHSSTTHGVWSVIEKDLDVSNISKHPYKRKRNTKLFSKDELGSDEARLQQLALSAIKEAAGIDQTDLVVLESSVVYSLSKEKTAARFYVVQCTQSITEDLQVPVKDVIESLQGPLVEKISCGWKVTPVVEYFHVLPYAGILSDWIFREVCSNGLQDIRVEVKNVDVNSCQRMKNPWNKEMTEVRDKSSDNDCLADSISSQASSGNNESPKQNCASTSGVKVERVDSVMKSCVAEYRSNGVDAEDKICSNILADQDSKPAGDLAPVPFQSDSKYLERLQATLALKEKELSQTALRVLRMKREKLSHQLREIGDEIALCDKDIQTILDGTG